MKNQVVTTEKYLPFQLSRVRFAPLYGPQIQPLVVTGTFQEQVNSVCLWQYGLQPDYADRCTTAEVLDGLPSTLNDSTDDPRLVCSIGHPGDIQQLRTHAASRLLFTASSLGFVGIYSLRTPEEDRDGLFRISELHKWTRLPTNALDELIREDTPISDVAVSADASQVYVGDDMGRLTVLDTEILTVRQKVAVEGTGFDVATINAIEVVDAACIATANQVGHLNVWDLRTPQKSNMSQRRIMPMCEPRPLVSLSQHPGQPHLLAVGGVTSDVTSVSCLTARQPGVSRLKVTNSTSTNYIWDLRADKHPLSEISCPGSAVWEIQFHPLQPQQLYMATEEAGLMRIQSSSPAESWSFMKSCHKKLSATCVSPNPSDCCSVNTFDLAGGMIVCGRDNCVLQTINDSSVSAFACA